MSEAQIAEALGLHDIKTRPWSIKKTSAIKGEGLFEVRMGSEMDLEGLLKVRSAGVIRKCYATVYRDGNIERRGALEVTGLAGHRLCHALAVYQFKIPNLLKMVPSLVAAMIPILFYSSCHQGLDWLVDTLKSRGR